MPEWSPDGKKIAIGTRKGIYVMGRDGSHRSFIALDGFIAVRSLLGPDAPLSWQPIKE